MPPAARLRQNLPLLVSRRADRYLFYSRRSGEVSLFNPDGKHIWDLFARPTSRADALKQLAAERPLSGAAARSVLRFVELLRERGYLVDDGPAYSPVIPDNPVKPASPERDALTSLYLHVTNRCNLKCLYCYNEGYRAASVQDRELSLAEMRDIVEQAHALQVRSMTFTGGEPLIRREAIQVARYARSLGLRTTCLTNGTLLRRRVDAVAEAFDHVVVSLDSWQDEENALIRVGSKLDKIAEGTRALVATGTGVSLRPVITRFNVHSLAGFPEYAVRHLGSIDFMPALCSPSEEGDEDLYQFLPEVEDYREALRAFNENLRRLGGHTDDGAPVAKPSGQCGAGTGLLSIAANGDVFPCQVLQQPGHAVGNVREQSIESIWRDSKALQRFRLQPPQRFESCSRCAIAGLCSFNCRAVFGAFNDSEADFTAHVCRYAQAEVEDHLWQEALRQAPPAPGTLTGVA